jgi:hypothetical protein
MQIRARSVEKVLRRVPKHSHGCMERENRAVSEGRPDMPRMQLSRGGHVTLARQRGCDVKYRLSLLRCYRVGSKGKVLVNVPAGNRFQLFKNAGRRRFRAPLPVPSCPRQLIDMLVVEVERPAANQKAARSVRSPVLAWL